MSSNERRASWLQLIQSVVLRMPERFSLHDLDLHFDTFRRAYPNNRNVGAKVRQTLQRLRDQGVIVFLKKGTYRRLVPRPAPSIDIDFSNVAHFKSKSQRARVALETWARLNLWCHNCGNPNLATLPPNAPVADLYCPACAMQYQVKSQDGRFGDAILGAGYEPLYQRILAKDVPDYLLIEYDSKREQLVHVNLIRGIDFTPECLQKRKELSQTARRAGWVGCNIRISGMPQIPIVGPSFISRT